MRIFVLYIRYVVNIFLRIVANISKMRRKRAVGILAAFTGVCRIRPCTQRTVMCHNDHLGWRRAQRPPRHPCDRHLAPEPRQFPLSGLTRCWAVASLMSPGGTRVRTEAYAAPAMVQDAPFAPLACNRRAGALESVRDS